MSKYTSLFISPSKGRAWIYGLPMCYWKTQRNFQRYHTSTYYIYVSRYPFHQTFLPQGLRYIDRLPSCQQLKQHNTKGKYIRLLCELPTRSIFGGKVPIILISIITRMCWLASSITNAFMYKAPKYPNVPITLVVTWVSVSAVSFANPKSETCH